MDIIKLWTDKTITVLIAGAILGMILSLIIFSFANKSPKKDSENTTNTVKTDNNSNLNADLLAANNLLNSGKNDEAIAIYKKILTQKPASIGAINNLAIAYSRKNELEKARQTLENAINIHSKTSFSNLQALYAHLADVSYNKVKIGIDLRTNSSSKTPIVDKTPNPVELILSNSVDDNHNIVIANNKEDLKKPNITIQKLPYEKISDLPPLPGQDEIIEVVKEEKTNSQSTKSLELKPQQVIQTTETAKNLTPAETISEKSIKTVKPEATEKLVNKADSPKKDKVQAVKKDKVQAVKKDMVKEPDKKEKTTTDKNNSIKEDKSKNDALKSKKLEIFLTLSGWAQTWSSKDMAKYFSYYSSNFSPPNGQSIEDWKKARDERITPRKQISVGISKINIDEVSNGKYEVSFNQSYEADGTKLNSRKKILIQSEKGTYKILQENVK